MNSILLKNASVVIPETELLVNIVRLRVRQLVSGHRSLIVAPPGMGLADIALSEIAAGKLSAESTGPSQTLPAAPDVIAFPKGAAAARAA